MDSVVSAAIRWNISVKHACPSDFAIILYNWSLFDAAKEGNQTGTPNQETPNKQTKSFFPPEEQK